MIGRVNFKEPTLQTDLIHSVGKGIGGHLAEGGNPCFAEGEATQPQHGNLDLFGYKPYDMPFQMVKEFMAKDQFKAVPIGEAVGFCPNSDLRPENLDEILLRKILAEVPRISHYIIPVKGLHGDAQFTQRFCHEVFAVRQRIEKPVSLPEASIPCPFKSDGNILWRDLGIAGIPLKDLHAGSLIGKGIEFFLHTFTCFSRYGRNRSGSAAHRDLHGQDPHWQGRSYALHPPSHRGQ